MRRTILLLASVLMTAVALGSDSPKEYDDRTKVDKLEGTWRLVDVQVDGVSFTNAGFVNTYHDGVWISKSEDNRRTYKGSYRFNTEQKPTQLDIVNADGPFASTTSKYLYQVIGNTLKTAGHLGEGERPSGFDEKRDVVICTYKRVK